MQRHFNTDKSEDLTIQSCIYRLVSNAYRNNAKADKKPTYCRPTCWTTECECCSSYFQRCFAY